LAALIAFAGAEPTPASEAATQKTPADPKAAAKAPVTKTGASKAAPSKIAASASPSKKAVSKKTAKQAAAVHRTVQQQPTPERYKEIQQALANKGYFKGTLDGNWGPDSVDALKSFQHDQNLPEDGKIGSLALIALGLGPKHDSGEVPSAISFPSSAIDKNAPQ
jgi:peptidoglycan hydrolase-like protein with peptidoglycan-binding domain